MSDWADLLRQRGIDPDAIEHGAVVNLSDDRPARLKPPPMPKASTLERDFANRLAVAGLLRGMRTEYEFRPARNSRFDFAWPGRMVAVEIEGGVWSKGRHTRGYGFMNDCEKYNAASALGWRLYRIPGPWLTSAKHADDIAAVMAQLRIALSRRTRPRGWYERRRGALGRAA